MKKLLLLLIIIFSQIFGQSVPFGRGVNLSLWMQADSPEHIPFNRYNKEDFENIKSLGCDVIRLPINLHAMTTGSPDYTIKPLFFYFLDKAVTWAEETGMHLIIDNHTFDVEVSTSPDVEGVLIPVWRQIAERYKDFYQHLYFEILNEPHGINSDLWGSIQGNVINAIREIDTVHYIIPGPADWNSYNSLSQLPEYDDDKLIYTFHYYSPFIFTHQGAVWAQPDLSSLRGVPFPYNASDMPECPPDLIGTWIESTLQNYSNTGTISALEYELNVVAEFSAQRNVPVFCGEFGVYRPYSPPADRVLWYREVRRILEEYNIAWTSWDYQEGFGLFKDGTNELFDYDLNLPLLQALGLNIPAQYQFEIIPDSTDIVIYDDYFSKGFTIWSHPDSDVNYYNSENAATGNYAISWENGTLYNSLSLNFKPERDFTYLMDNDFIFSIMIKGNTPGSKFDIRLLDTDEGENDHPWRLGVTIDDSYLSWDGQWHKVEIPLSEFIGKGAWENDTWYNPPGFFDISKVDIFEIVAEHHTFEGMEFGFDEIKFRNPNPNSVEDDNIPDKFSVSENYPNPFNPATKIKFTIPYESRVRISVYNITGEKITDLINDNFSSGAHEVIFNAENLPSGIYFYHFSAGDFNDAGKMVLLK